MKVQLALLFIVCSMGFALKAHAQDPTYDPFNQPADQPFGGQPEPKPEESNNRRVQYKYPAAMTVNRPTPVMPTKPQLVAPKTPEVQTKLNAFDDARRLVLKDIDAARARNDFDAIAKFCVRLDEIRQDRLALLRDVAKRVVPAKPTGESNDGSAPAPANGLPTSRPILPLPQFTPKQSK